MNRFGYKTQNNAQLSTINAHVELPCVFPTPSILTQQPALSLFNSLNALGQQMSNVSTNQYTFDANYSDDEDLEEQEISLILQQNLLLNCLISQIESDLGQISSNLQKHDTTQPDNVAVSSTTNISRRRTPNGIKKLAEKVTGSKGPFLSNLLKKKVPKKLATRKMILTKKLCLSRKIAEKLFKKQVSPVEGL
mmetsp:Transcript_11388/g.13044  ORF Transcript_11388/g.13044 Transcript_11388/m.13044 type:complete len:193 (-) Transcript_11388:179-757(-)